MCWTRFKTRFFAVRVPQGGSTRQQNNARLLTGGRRAARAESFDYYSVAGDPARGGTMRRRAGRARADGGAAPSGRRCRGLALGKSGPRRGAVHVNG
jgi:hypothetical protein